MRLDMMAAGERCKVLQVCGGGAMMRRLTELGIVPGSVVTVLSDPRGFGPIMVGIGSMRLGLGRGMARRIMVRPI